MAAAAFANVDPRLLAEKSSIGITSATAGLSQFLGQVTKGIEASNKAKMQAGRQKQAEGEIIQARGSNSERVAIGAVTAEYGASTINEGTTEVEVVDANGVEPGKPGYQSTKKTSQVSAFTVDQDVVDYYDKPSKDDKKYKTKAGDFDNKAFRADRHNWREKRRGIRRNWRQEGILKGREVKEQYEDLLEDGVIDASEQIKLGKMPRRFQKKILKALGDSKANIKTITDQAKYINTQTGGINQAENPMAYRFALGASNNGVFAIPGLNGEMQYATYTFDHYESDEAVPEELRTKGVKKGDKVINKNEDGTYEYDGEGNPVTKDPTQILLPSESFNSEGKFFKDTDLNQTISMVETDKGDTPWNEYLATSNGQKKMQGVMQNILFKQPAIAFIKYPSLDKNGDELVDERDLAKFDTNDYQYFLKGREDQIASQVGVVGAEAAIERTTAVVTRINGLNQFEPGSDEYEQQSAAVLQDIKTMDLGFEYENVTMEDGVLTFEKVLQDGEKKVSKEDLVFDLNTPEGQDAFSYENAEGTDGEASAIEVGGVRKSQNIIAAQEAEKEAAKVDETKGFFHEGTKVEDNDVLIAGAGYSSEQGTMLHNLALKPFEGINANNYTEIVTTSQRENTSTTRQINTNPDGTFVTPADALLTRVGKKLTSMKNAEGEPLYNNEQIIKIVSNYPDIMKGNIDISKLALDSEVFATAANNRRLGSVVEGVNVIADAPAVEAVPEVIIQNEEQLNSVVSGIDIAKPLQKKLSGALRNVPITTENYEQVKELVYNNVKYGPDRTIVMKALGYDSDGKIIPSANQPEATPVVEEAVVGDAISDETTGVPNEPVVEDKPKTAVTKISETDDLGEFETTTRPSKLDRKVRKNLKKNGWEWNRKEKRWVKADVINFDGDYAETFTAPISTDNESLGRFDVNARPSSMNRDTKRVLRKNGWKWSSRNGVWESPVSSGATFETKAPVGETKATVPKATVPTSDSPITKTPVLSDYKRVSFSNKTQMKGVNVKVKDTLNSIAKDFDYDLVVTSGHRDKDHPLEKNKKYSGPHVTGEGVDISVPKGISNKKFAEQLSKKYPDLFEVVYYDGHVHIGYSASSAKHPKGGVYSGGKSK